MRDLREYDVLEDVKERYGNCKFEDDEKIVDLDDYDQVFWSQNRVINILFDCKT
jgi:hypothetical protein